MRSSIFDRTVLIDDKHIDIIPQIGRKAYSNSRSLILDNEFIVMIRYSVFSVLGEIFRVDIPEFPITRYDVEA